MSNVSNPQVLILWADGKSSNLGVQALAAGTGCMVEHMVGPAEITYVSYGPASSLKLELTARNLGSALLGGNRELRRWISGFDLVIDTGAGDSFSDIYGVRRLAEMSALRVLIARAKIPLVMGPQTIGPFDTRFGTWMARHSVGRESVIIARDRQSQNIAQALFNRPVALASDVAFLIPVEQRDSGHGVALNVSGLLWQKNPHVDYHYYRDQVIRFAELVLSGGNGLTLISHVIDSNHEDNDIGAVDECSTLLSGGHSIYHPVDLTDVRTRLACSSFVVAARMHAVLNSLSQGVPAVAWSYSRKFAPLLDDLKWKHKFDLRDQRMDTAEETFKLFGQLSSMRREAAEVKAIAQSKTENVMDNLDLNASAR